MLNYPHWLLLVWIFFSIFAKRKYILKPKNLKLIIMKAIDNLIGKKVIVRSYGAGVFFGTLNDVEKCEDKWTVELLNSRRIWYWEGACSITQLAVDGTKNPSGCKFTVIEPSVIVSGVVELHECSETAVKSIESVQEWKK